MWRRYACVRQADQSDCGAAALATVARQYRRPIGVQQVRDLAGTDRVGTNLLGLVDAAEALGFSAKGVKGTYEALSHVPLPAIAHIKTEAGLGHFIVLHHLTRQGVVVADPARGLQTLSRDAFCQRWTGHLLLLVPEQAMTTPARGSTPITPGRRFLGLLRPHLSLLTEAFCCALLMTVLGVANSYFIQHLVDSVLVRQETQLLNALGMGMVLVILFRTLFGILRQYLVAHISRKVNLTLVAGYTQHLLALPLRFFEMRRVGEILSRTNDATRVREAISNMTLTAVVDGTLVALMVIVLWLYDVPLALVATAFIPVLVLSVAAHRVGIRRRAREVMEHTAQLSAHLVEDIAGVETIKAFGAERLRAEDGEARLIRVVQSTFAQQLLGISMQTLGTVVTSVASLVVLWYGSVRVMEGALTIGQLMFFNSLLGYVLTPLERLASVSLTLQDALVAVDRLFQILDLEGERSTRQQALFTEIRDALALHDVSFCYGRRANVLEAVTMRIPAGATVAIVGESGSGKSTLLKLLMGFYQPTDGRILIDGVDLRDFAVDSLRSRIGLVAQEPFIFNGTVRENIALGRPGATLAEIAQAARAAGLEAFIAGLPERYDTIIGERGANLSGGQKQRLAIARVLVRAPELVIFDEATSHLDTATERAIQDSLKTVLAGKTVVLVAHRLSTIKDADLIYVLHQGRILQSGTHRQLLAQEGLYQTLWRVQTAEEAPRIRLPEVRGPRHERNGSTVEGVAHAY